MFHFVICDNATKELICPGVADDIRNVQAQTTETQTAYVVPESFFSLNRVPNYEALFVFLHKKIDGEAGAFRSRFITDAPGQAQTYERKEREARDWVEGTSDPNDFPFMSAEATVTGKTIAQVRDSILAQVNALVPLAAQIEAHRIKAKQDVSSTNNVPDAFAATEVDWEMLLP